MNVRWKLPLKLLLGLLAFSSGLMAQDYLYIIAPEGVHIRTGPSTRNFIIGVARYEEIYTLEGEADDWYLIQMFSGEPRYINKCCARVLLTEEVNSSYDLNVPRDEEVLEAMYDRTLRSRRRVRLEADEVLPLALDPLRHDNFGELMEDRYMLELFQRYAIHPALYTDFLTVAGMYIE